MSEEILRIGCGAGFWGDSAEGPRQLVESGEIDVLVLDYLAEITMSLLAKARAKNPALGYATDFPEVIERLAPQIKEQKLKVVTNAGGVNPQACREAIQSRLKALGIDMSIGIITGDDLLARTAEFREAREMFTGEDFPAKPWSSNAYLGAFPIASALEAGADIVITGRCVDSALVLGPLIHKFGWKADDYDKLSAGSLAGHVVECGAQATGGIVTDWRTVASDWDRMGFPIAQCRADGSFVATKPKGTGGRVAPETVAEQIVYEIGDPGAYLLPDVTCDWREVSLTQAGPDRVEVKGARGRAPSDRYKVSTTWQDGFRLTGTMMLGGPDAVGKAEAVAGAVFKRTRRLFAERGYTNYRRTDVEVLGAEANYGASSRTSSSREVILKMAAHHDDKEALELLGREMIPAATAMAQGITGFSGGRPSATPLVRLFSWLVPKSAVPVNVDVDGQTVVYVPPRVEASAEPAIDVFAEAGPSIDDATPDETVEQAPHRGNRITAPLIAIAYGRSGDKGDAANIGVLARKPEYLPVLQEQLTASAVRKYLAHFVKGKVERFEIPGLHGFNFLLHNALGGGGMASLRYDPQGKMLAQILMDFPVQVPDAWLAA